MQDAKMFRRKKWKYLILDEAHMIKNWKSQRWQTLLNFNSKRRLLITGQLPASCVSCLQVVPTQQHTAHPSSKLMRQSCPPFARMFCGTACYELPSLPCLHLSLWSKHIVGDDSFTKSKENTAAATECIECTYSGRLARSVFRPHPYSPLQELLNTPIDSCSKLLHNLLTSSSSSVQSWC